MRVDPRVRKRQEALLRSELIELVEQRLGSRRCFWTWVWGHDWGRTGWVKHRSNFPVRDVTTCVTCGLPCSWASFTSYDVLRFAEEGDLLTDEESEEFTMRWRDVP